MASPAKPRALGVVGDFYHPHAGVRDLLERAAPEFDWSFEADPRRVDWSALGAFDLVLLSAEDRVEPDKSEARWMTEAIGAKIEAFVASGGGLFGYHSGLASYAEDSAIRRLLGGGFQFHPKAHPTFSVVPTGEHPILEGVAAFTITDEMYFVDRDPGSTLPLAATLSPRFGSSCAAWCSERGAGRVACVTPGHRPEVLRDPNLTRLVGNAARWSARRRP